MGKNTLIYGIGNIGARGASFFLIPLYTYYLSVNDYGILVSLLAVAQLMVVLMSLGSRHGFIRFAKEYQDRQQLGSLLTTSNALNITGGLLVTILSLLFLLPFFRSFLHITNVLSYVVLICALSMFQSLTLHTLSYYRIKNEGVKFVIVNLLAMFSQLGLTYFFLNILNLGIRGALLAQIIIYGILWVAISSDIFTKIGMGISFKTAVKLFKYGTPLIFVLSSGFITDTAAMYMLSRFTGLEDVAIYALGIKIAGIVTIAIILPFQLAYEPFVYSNIDTPGINITISKLLTYLLFLFAFVVFGMAVFSKTILNIIAPPEYSSAYLIILIILPGMAFNGVKFIGESLINIRKKTYITAYIVGAFTLINFALNFWLISKYGRYGAAIVVSITAAATSIMMIILGKKYFPIPLEKIRLTVSVALLSGFLLLVYCMRNSSAAFYYGMFPLAIVGSLVLIYFGNLVNEKEKIAIAALLKKMKILSPTSGSD